MEALTMPSTPVLIYGILVAIFVLIAIPMGRMINKSNQETEDEIARLQKHH